MKYGHIKYGHMKYGIRHMSQIASQYFRLNDCKY